jgi:hypothetical protein
VDVGDYAFAVDDANLFVTGLAFRAGRAIGPEKNFFAGSTAGDRVSVRSVAKAKQKLAMSDLAIGIF